MKYFIVLVLIIVFSLPGYSLEVKIDDTIKLPQKIKDRFITSFACNNDEIYIGTWQGVVVYNQITKEWKEISKKQGLSPVFVTSLFYSKNKVLYIGTSYAKNSGLFKYENNELSSINLNSKETLNITTIHGNDNKIYIGTFGQGIFILENEVIKKLNTKASYITSIKTKNDLIYASSKYKGVFVISEKGETILEEHSSELPNNSVSEVYIPENGDIWFGTWGGASLLKDGQWTTFFKYVGQLQNSNIKCITGDNKNIYIGTDAGISIFTEDKNFINITQEKYPLPSNNILTLCKVKSFLWVGTDKGLVKFGIHK